jgi:hypothetical protein
MFIVRAARNLLPFDLQKGFTIIGHSLSSTFFPGRTRKSPELIFILIPSVSRAAWVALSTHGLRRTLTQPYFSSVLNASKPEMTSNSSSSMPSWRTR